MEAPESVWLCVSGAFPRGIPPVAVGPEPAVPLRCAVPWCRDPVFRQGVSLGSRGYFRGICNKLRQVNADRGEGVGRGRGSTPAVVVMVESGS